MQTEDKKEIEEAKKAALEVLLDLVIIFPEVLVHRRADLDPGCIEVTAAHDRCPLAEGQHAGLPAHGFEV